MKLHVGRDFSDTPGGRFMSDGPFSGELFRERVLVPKLREAIAQKDRLIVELDGPAGYLSSFLEEAFGGIVRKKHFAKDIVLQHLQLSFIDPYYETYKRIAELAIQNATIDKKLAG